MNFNITTCNIVMFKIAINNASRVARLNVSTNKKSALNSTVISIRDYTSTKRITSTKNGNENDHDFTSPLPYKKLPYNSIELDCEYLPIQDTSEFGSRLYSTIEYSKNKNINSIFLRIPMIYSHYIPIAGLYGFKYHRAESDIAYLLLWLPKDLKCNVPLFATHHVGVVSWCEYTCMCTCVYL